MHSGSTMLRSQDTDWVAVLNFFLFQRPPPSFTVLITHYLIEFSFLVWESSHKDCVRGEARVWVRRQQTARVQGQGSVVLPQACAHQLPLGQSAFCCDLHLYPLSSHQHLRESPSGGQGQTEVLHHPPAQGRPLPIVSVEFVSGLSIERMDIMWHIAIGAWSNPHF